MPDLFLGAAAGPPGLPDWIDHAFPDPVKNDPAYLATAVAALGALFFQDSVLPELRPLATDPPGEADRRLAMIFHTCFESIAQPGGTTFSAILPPAGMANEDKGAFFAAQEADFFTAVPRVLAAQIRSLMSAPGKFENLLKTSSGLSSLHLQVPSKTQKVGSSYRNEVSLGNTVDESAFQARCSTSPTLEAGLVAAYSDIITHKHTDALSSLAAFWAAGPDRDYMVTQVLCRTMRPRMELADESLWALSHLLEVRDGRVAEQIQAVMPFVTPQRRSDWRRWAICPASTLPADRRSTGSTAQPDFFQSNLKDLLGARSQTEPVNFELGEVQHITTIYKNFLALIQPIAPETASVAEQSAFQLAMTDIWSSGLQAELDPRLLSVLIYSEWVLPDITAVIAQLQLNRSKPVSSSAGGSFVLPSGGRSIPYFQPVTSSTTPDSMAAGPSSVPEPGWRRIKARKASLLNFLDSFDPAAEQSNQFRRALSAGLHSAISWDTRYQRHAGSAVKGSFLQSSTHVDWSANPATVSHHKGVFYYLNPVCLSTVAPNLHSTNQPAAPNLTAAGGTTAAPISKNALKKARKRAKLDGSSAASPLDLSIAAPKAPPTTSPASSTALVPSRGSAHAAAPAPAAPAAIMMAGAGQGALTFPSVPSPQNYQRGALEKVLIEEWGATTEFTDKMALKGDQYETLITDPSGSIVRWKPTEGWKQASTDGTRLRLCYKDLVAKLSCGVVGPETSYSKRRQMTPDDIPTIVKVGCGCLSSRTDAALPADATSCCHGAHWDLRAGAGQFGSEVPPAKDSLQVSAGNWFLAFSAMKPHFDKALSTVELPLKKYEADQISASSFDAYATVV